MAARADGFWYPDDDNRDRVDHITWGGTVETYYVADDGRIVHDNEVTISRNHYELMQRKVRELEEQVQIAREYQRAKDVQYLKYVNLLNIADLLEKAQL